MSLRNMYASTVRSHHPTSHLRFSRHPRHLHVALKQRPSKQADPQNYPRTRPSRGRGNKKTQTPIEETTKKRPSNMKNFKQILFTQDGKTRSQLRKNTETRDQLKAGAFSRRAPPPLDPPASPPHSIGVHPGRARKSPSGEKFSQASAASCGRGG